MKYLIIIVLLIISIQPLSYAKYNWGKRNWLGAVGAILIALAAVVFPSAMLILR
jgi:hypothetical protein